MSTTNKRFCLNLREWTDNFQNEEECADFSVRILKQICTKTEAFSNEMHEYFQKFPEIMAIAGAHIKMDVSFCNSHVARYEVGVKDVKEEEK